MLRITNCELRGMHSNGDPADTCGQVIAGQGPLAAFIKAAMGIQRKWMRRNGEAAEKPGAKLSTHSFLT